MAMVSCHNVVIRELEMLEWELLLELSVSCVHGGKGTPT